MICRRLTRIADNSSKYTNQESKHVQRQTSLVFYPTLKSDYQSALRFIEHRYLSARQSTNLVYIHHTCATDTHNVSAVFSACSDAILNLQMCAIGMA